MKLKHLLSLLCVSCLDQKMLFIPGKDVVNHSDVQIISFYTCQTYAEHTHLALTASYTSNKYSSYNLVLFLSIMGFIEIHFSITSVYLKKRKGKWNCTRKFVLGNTSDHSYTVMAVFSAGITVLLALHCQCQSPAACFEY